MGLLWKVKVNLYNGEYTNPPVASYDMRWGIPVGDGRVPETTLIDDNTPLDFFEPYLGPGEIKYLGGPVMTPSNPYNVYTANRFLPLCAEYQQRVETTNLWVEWVFSNGVYIREDTAGGAGGNEHVYDPQGVEIETFPPFYIVSALSNGYPGCHGFVASGITGREITGDLLYMFMDAKYVYGNWRQRVGGVLPDENSAKLKNLLNNNIEPDATEDPYSMGGESTTGGGTGTFSDVGDSVDFPSLPTLSAIGTGFVTLYNPTIPQLLALSNYMWQGSPQTIEFWKKIVADPIDLILGLNIVPVAVPDTGIKAVTVGAVSTDVNMTYTNTQYVEVDCGSINVQEFWGAYLDYSPYTKFEIYLPYCGTHPLIADEVMGKNVHVKYHVDILSGACVAYVKCGNSVLYSFAGNVASQIPVTANQFGDMVRSAISIAASIGSMMMTDGASAPFAISSIASTATNSTALKPSTEKSGAIGGMAGQLGIQKPYLIVTRPKQCVPGSQNHFTGYPAYITKDLNTVSGFTVVDTVHLEGFTCTDDELNEIESLLKSGVML